MTPRTRKIVGWTFAVVLAIGYLVGSEVYYARIISPHGVSTARDFFDRFGEPQHVWMVKRDGKSYYEFTGHLPPRLVAAYPSSPPAYVFDEQGRFVTWCSDPGDQPSHRRDWPVERTNQVEVTVVRERLGLR